jgi:hypothetical protein
MSNKLLNDNRFDNAYAWRAIVDITATKIQGRHGLFIMAV